MPTAGSQGDCWFPGAWCRNSYGQLSRNEGVKIMHAMKLADVRQHTGRKLTYDEAIKLANPGDPFLRNMAIALSLMTWRNTREDWLRLEAALVILHRRKGRK
jgi:hypothetical protein